MEKLNLTQQKNTFTNQPLQHTKHKKLKPGLVASYEIGHVNGQGLFLFWHFINLPLIYLRYLDTYPVTYSPGTQTGAHTG